MKTEHVNGKHQRGLRKVDEEVELLCFKQFYIQIEFASRMGEGISGCHPSIVRWVFFSEKF